MNPRAMAAIEGARIGATIGMPFRGAKSFKRIHFYEPIPARQSSSETIDAWLIFANAVRQGLEPQDASQMIAKHWSYTTNESAFAKRNWQLGFLAPASGYFDNPLAMGSQALGRSVFWGVVNAGDPNRASEFAYYDAASDHSGTGVIAAVVLARMAAIAGHGTNLADLARIATIAADYDARCAQAVRIAIQTAGGGKDIQTLHQRLWEGVSEGDVHNAALNLGFAVGSLLLGKSDFESTMCGCAGLGGSSDQTCIATSTLLCLMHGAAPEDWTKPIGRELVFGHGLRDIDIPISIEDFANLIPSSELAIPTTLKVSSELQPIESADTDEEFSA